MRHFALLIAFTSAFLSAVAQQTDYNFINFTSKNGLSSNTVNAIIKDRYGYMWFATEDGLNKFDGVNFTVYRHQQSDSTSIGEGNVATLHEDHDGNLWIGAGNTLSMYNREKDAFINNVLQGVIRSVCIDHSGNIWIGTYSGLFIMDHHTGKVTKNSFNPDNANKLVSDAVVWIFEDSHKRIWLATNTGIYQTTTSGRDFRRFVPIENDPSSIPDITARAIVEDRSGNIWFGTKENGLAVLEPGSNAFKTYRHRKDDNTTLSGDRIYALAADDEGKIWVGSENGMDIFDPRSLAAFRLSLEQRKKYSFTGKSIRSIYIDKDGICWIGTFRAGINKYDKSLAFFNHRQSNAYDPLGLTSPIVTSFTETPDGDIYMGTDGGGLHLFHRKTGLFDHPQIVPPTQNKAHSILAMELAGNDLWIGTYPDGVYVKNINSGNVRHYVQGSGKKDLSSNEIFCINKDSKGNIWIGTNGNGLCRYDPNTGTFDRFDPRAANNKISIPSNGFIRGITEDKYGNMWFASNGTGIAVYDPLHGTFRHFTPQNSNLSYEFVSSLYTAKDGTVWAGTGGRGLCRFDYSTGKFISYSEKDGLANGFVYKILEDDAGKLWISTNKGVSSFDVKSNKFRNYTYHNGLQQTSYCGGAGIKTSSGELFFGGLDGFNYFNPLSFHSNRNIPSLVFTDLKLANKSVVPDDDAPIQKHISIADKIRLKYKQNFSIDFAALNYTAPQETRYSYMLDGFDKSWNDAGPSKTAVYTNLAPGKYTFRVKAKNEEGSWNTPETTIDIYVTPPFWRTVYAYIIYAMVVVLIIWSIRHVAIRRVRNKYKAEKEREQLNQMLEQERKETQRQHEFDQLRIKFLTNLSHEFRTPVSLIVSPAEQLLQEETSDIKRQQISLIRRNARRLLNMVNQLLDFRKMEASELKLDLTDTDIIFFIKETADSFKDIAQRKGIDFCLSGSLEHYHTLFDKDKVERIFFNLLSNAFKFTKENGKIALKIEPGSVSGIRVIVDDTGIGMDADTREKIFDRFYQGESTTAILNQGSGIGLSIVRDFINLHGGTIDVKSIPGKGTSFIVEFPFKEIVKENEAFPLNGNTHKALPFVVAEEKNADAEKPVILLIDDHEDFLSYLSSNLKNRYKIIEASNGKQGWQKALSCHPQVIVSDIDMPVMDGITLCRKLRFDKRTRHIPIILLTGLTGVDNQLKGLDTGANDYLTKPFNFEILNLRIRNLLNLNQDLKNTYSRQLKLSNPTIDIESEDEKMLRCVIQFIEANLDSPDLSVEELSKQVGMGRSTLYNKIVALTGETPVEFIRTVKLDKAAALLESSDMLVSQVGYSVGFATPSHFAQAFKSKFDLSPSQYAKLKRKLV